MKVLNAKKYLHKGGWQSLAQKIIDRPYGFHTSGFEMSGFGGSMVEHSVWIRTCACTSFCGRDFSCLNIFDTFSWVCGCAQLALQMLDLMKIKFYGVITVIQC